MKLTSKDACFRRGTIATKKRSNKMTSDTLCPLSSATSSCPAEPHWLAVLEVLKSIHQTLQNEGPKVKNSSKAISCRLCVNEIILALQLKYPERVWTSDSFAKEIGCTGAAVRQTKSWKEYQERLQIERQKHPQRKDNGKRGNCFETSNADREDDF